MTDQPQSASDRLSSPTIYLTAIKLIGNLGIAAGVISTSDSSKIEGALTIIITSVFSIVAAFLTLKHVIVAEFQLKSQDPDTAPDVLRLDAGNDNAIIRRPPLPVILCALTLSWPAIAEAQFEVPRTPACFGNNSKPAAPASDPATIAALSAIAQQVQNNGAILAQVLAQLQAKANTPAPVQTPAPSPQVIVLGGTGQASPSASGGNGPLYALPPIGGAPLYTLPSIGGTPLYALPGIGGQPLYQLPQAGGTPLYVLPGAGQTPLYQLPGIGGPPASPLPAIGGSPATPTPAPVPPAPITPQIQLPSIGGAPQVQPFNQPPVPPTLLPGIGGQPVQPLPKTSGPPVGYQTFTRMPIATKAVWRPVPDR